MKARLGVAYLVLGFVPVAAAEHRGVVRFNSLPVPGVSITATQGEKRFTTATDASGRYTIPDLKAGVWTVVVEMQCFVSQQRQIEVPAMAPAAIWDLELFPCDRRKTQTPAEPAKPANPQGAPNSADAGSGAAFQPATAVMVPNAGNLTVDANAQAGALQDSAADGFLINGSVNNSSNSPFAQSPAFGNFRTAHNPYQVALGFTMDLSALDARPYSLAARSPAPPTHNLLTGTVSFGGPLRIPKIWSPAQPPSFFLSYEWTRNRVVTTGSGIMPDRAQRSGDLSQARDSLGNPLTVFDPTTRTPFPGNRIPEGRISPQAKALLGLYPMPTVAAGNWNYAAPLPSNTHRDMLRSSVHMMRARNSLSADAMLDSTRGDSSTLLGFLDTERSHGMQATAYWGHSFSSRFSTQVGIAFNRRTEHSIPYFAQRENISGNIGILGNNQDPVNWGPPNLSFSSGISPLNESAYSWRRRQTATLTFAANWGWRGHTLRFGTDFSRIQMNLLSQQNARGAFRFDGAATGYDFADFLLGIPDSSSVAFGNADKYFRSNTSNAFVTDDWRVSSRLTLNAGARWEYMSPPTEKYGRLVNLDIAPGFVAAIPVMAGSPTGSLTGVRYPSALLSPYRRMFEPRVALAWVPSPTSPIVIRAGYGIYADTAVYESIVLQMAQQTPLSKNFSLQNNTANSLTLANGFTGAANPTLGTFAVDPGFRPGYAQNWQFSVQDSLRGGLVATATYIGIKGTHARQSVYPNTYPAGANAPCAACPSGFEYLGSGGNSTYQAARFQLRRRLQSGLSASVQYTWSKAIDDAALGGGGQGSLVAQNWLDLRSERALSSFDQRHLVDVQFQYSTGMGIRGGTLLDGWRGGLFKHWTILNQITAGSGMPLTPIYPALVSGTGFHGNLRPDYTGASLYDAPPGLALNPAAFAPPRAGSWGNAGRNIITGPERFSWNASLQRTFPLRDRVSLDLRVDATNLLNHVTYVRWDTNLTSSLFGLPTAANSMRTLTTRMQVRF